MKKSVRYLLMALTAVLITSAAQAEKVPGVVTPSGGNKKIAAGCLPATSATELDINNVRARINTGGDMWWDLQGEAQYEIPKGSKKTSMFSASLWIGGLDVNDQLKLAALRYRQIGNDYWPGPLTIDGTAAVDDETCSEYDRHFIITRAEVAEFLSYIDEATGVFVPTPDYPAPPKIIQEWPWEANTAKGQSPYLAPFFDRNQNGIYEWELGDYPYYDFDRSNKLCKSDLPTVESTMGISFGGRLSDQILKGDKTIWWVFNDKGNIHTETGGEPIGLEIRAQAFGFTTNDEINDMTFYSYEIINRSTFRLTETYFSQWVDTDVGHGWDDYVGCDVLRGLGYCYNGPEIDGSGQVYAYGSNPPAVGVDFFQGPYMDPDGIDNPKWITNISIDSITGDTSFFTTRACDVSINGVNFEDGIVDNERFGMRRFVYHNNGGAAYMSDPDVAIEYYNFLRGIWKDGTKMLYGGNAHANSGAYGPECDFMFPGDSDPCDWGTGGSPPNGPKYWTEQTAGNQPFDRRFMQSAGPFTLESGAVNYITVGIPWARATSGGTWASVELLRIVDDKCQRLFDNCFAIVEGPDAPDLVIQELDKELILFLVNRKNNPNYNEDYSVYDPAIAFPDTIPSHLRGDSTYVFEGYQIFQVRDNTVTVSDIERADADKVRLVAQCDIKNDIARIINWEYDGYLELNVPREKVNGGNEGLFHSIKITEDKFASGDKKLVNNKKYYFIAIAYAHNEFAPYSVDPSVPDGLRGQKMPYLASRKTQAGGSIVAIPAIPHIPAPEAAGTKVNAKYGDGPKITRIEGNGNGGMVLDLTQESIDEIMAGAPHRSENPTYLNSHGPINVKVVDPLNVKPGKFTLKFDPTKPIGATTWTLYYENEGEFDTINSQKTIEVANEQLLLDYGIAITIGQVAPPGDVTNAVNNGFIEASMTFADSSKRWLTAVPDFDQPGPFNWIRSGTLDDNAQPDNNDYDPGNDGKNWRDPSEFYEKVLNGTWAPYRLASRYEHGPQWSKFGNLNNIGNLHSVDIVFTSDKSKWTRCPVIETGEDTKLTEGGAEKMNLREGASKDRDGNTGTPEATANGTQPEGMSFFPGYAINLETGERLNMAFGEDSWLAGENGRDMLFNPTSNYYSNLGITLGQILFGGKHFIYVFGHNSDVDAMPAYDEGNYMYNALIQNNQNITRRVYADAMWVNIPMIANDYKLDDPSQIPTDVKVRLRVSRPYRQFWAATTGPASPVNNNYPMYTFTTDDLATSKGVTEVAETALDLIRAVPNPYYAYSAYETDQLDNRIKITNLPEECTVSIYTVNGTLVRQFKKDDSNTYLEWDLKNYSGIPIAGGVYIIHINAPGIGEKTIKWFGTLRPVDLNAF
ncbi:MAG: T9SS type A sorting domain-containing protein [Bacteroidales bacterium]